MSDSPFLGKIIIISGPSGSGKTTCVNHLLSLPQLPLSYGTSYTTRKPRTGEKHGIDYYFVTRNEFIAGVDNGEFLEWEEVYSGDLYGTKKGEIEEAARGGKVYITELDIKGAINIKKIYKEKALVIFLEPPAIEALEERLVTRGNLWNLGERIYKSLMEWRLAKEEEQNDIILLPNITLGKTLKEITDLVTKFING